MTYKSDISLIKKEQKPIKSKKKKSKFNPASVPIYYLEDAEGHKLTPKQTIKVWQHYVNTGAVWKGQGWYGRTAHSMLQDGIIKFPKQRTYDYYGNPIPTRSEVKARGGIKTN